jgi:hypothetical protein
MLFAMVDDIPSEAIIIRVVAKGPPVPGDFDGDCDVDAADFDAFVNCATGPTVLYEPNQPPAGCPLDPGTDNILPTDFDGDRDVDHIDFSVLQRCLSGTGNPGDPLCNP